MFFINFGNAINFRGIWDKLDWHGEKAENPRPKVYHKYARKLNILEILYPELYPVNEDEEEPEEPINPDPVDPEPEPIEP